jgi:hypothetical protein
MMLLLIYAATCLHDEPRTRARNAVANAMAQVMRSLEQSDEGA